MSMLMMVDHALAYEKSANPIDGLTSRELMDSVDTVSLFVITVELAASPASHMPLAPLGSLGRFCR